MAKKDEKKGKNKSLKRSLSLSVLFHLILLIGLLLGAFWFYEERLASDSSEKSSPNGDSASKSLIPDFDPAEVAKAAKETMDKAMEEGAVSVEDKIDEVKDKMADTVDKMSLPDVKAAVKTAETFQKVDNTRAYEPRKNVAGPFDPNTATLNNIERVKKGEEIVYRYTLVDSEGRSMKTDVKLEDMSKSDLNTYRLFKMARNNKGFSSILKSAIKVAETKSAENRAK